MSSILTFPTKPLREKSMLDWQVEVTFKALAEMKASGYGNYLPFCVRPILAAWLKETGYQVEYSDGKFEGGKIVGIKKIPKELR